MELFEGENTQRLIMVCLDPLLTSNVIGNTLREVESEANSQLGKKKKANGVFKTAILPALLRS
jgi:hypothetical protein